MARRPQAKDKTRAAASKTKGPRGKPEPQEAPRKKAAPARPPAPPPAPPTRAGPPPVPSAETAPPSGDWASLLIGRVIAGRYRVDELVGTGGMGAVFRGQHLRMRNRVAIKVLHPHIEGFTDHVERFEREAIAGAHVHHPNVASATDFGQLEDGSYFLVLEYVRGATLSEILGKGPIPAARAARIARQIAAALHAAHEMGLVHRDVKPRNVMLVEGERDLVKLIDFGLAKVPVDRISTFAGKEAAEGLKALTAMGVVFGTIGYLAPEAALGMEAVDARSDLYALGCLFYEMLTGARPFDHDDPGQLFLKHRTERPPPFATALAIPPALEALVMRLLEKAAPKRPQTGLEVIEAIDAAIPAATDAPPPSSIPKDASDTSLAPPLLLRPPMVKPAPLWLVFLGVAVACLLVTTGLLRLRASSSGPSSAGSANAAASASAARTVGGLGATGWRDRLRAAADARQWAEARAAVVSLVRVDRDSLRDPDVVAIVVEVATALEFESSAAADEVFDVLVNQTGSDGLDVLYEIATTRTGSRAAKRADGLLARADVIPRATPALRVALELRAASCEAKRDLFDRAAAEGDRRTLTILKQLRAAECKRDADPCCFRKSRPLERAVASLEERLRG